MSLHSEQGGFTRDTVDGLFWVGLADSYPALVGFPIKQPVTLIHLVGLTSSPTRGPSTMCSPAISAQ
jgi:hypothetical protein